MEITLVKNFDEMNNFVLNHPYGNIMQTTYWAQIKKKDWKPHFLCFRQSGELVGTAMLLERPFLLGSSFFYCSRGPVIDYQNETLVKEAIEKIRAYIKKCKGFVCEFDPEMTYKCLSSQTLEEISNNKKIFDNISKYANHKGFFNDMGSSNQPRFQMVVDLSIPDLKAQINRKRRAVFSDTYLEKRGFEFVDITTLSGIDEFSRLSKITEKRQGIFLRNQDYFLNMFNTFEKKELIRIFGIKVDLNKLLDFLEETKQDKKYMNEINEIKNEEGQILFTNAIICVLGTNMVQMMYGASDYRFNRYNPGSKLHLNSMQWAKDNGFQYFNMGGVSGTFDDHLYKFKSVFNPMIYEYVGDFEIVSNKLIYMFFQIAKKAYSNLRMLPRKIFKRK